MEDHDSDHRPTVFLDTEIFVQQNFQYAFGVLAAFRQQVARGRVSCITTDITLDEVRARLSAEVDNAMAAMRGVKSKARLLRTSRTVSLARVFKPISRKRVLRDHLNQFDEFIHDLNPKVLTADSVLPSVVFQRYFRQEPPFHEQGKKCEFPDAFALEALRMYSEASDARIIVVTGDRGWEAAIAASSHLKYMERIDELLQSLLPNTDLVARARTALNDRSVHLESPISAEVLALPIFAGDRDAGVTIVEVTSVSTNDAFIVDVTNESVTFSMDVGVSIRADLELPPEPLRGRGAQADPYIRRPRYAHPDSPESAYGTETFTVVGTVPWDGATGEMRGDASVQIVNPRDFVVYVDDYYGS